LIASALGVWSLMLNRVLVQGFYARFDTKTPVKYGVYSMVSNMLFCLSIVIPLESYYPGYGYIGLALSTGLSAIVNTLCLIIGLYKNDIYRFSKTTVIFVVKTVLSAAVMCITLHYLCIFVFNVTSMLSWSQLNIIQSIIYLFILVFVGFISYIVVMLSTRALKLNKNLVD
jgi:putative peptidoglycan lipid II flippase